MTNNDVVRRILHEIAGRQVVVFGDLMLDEWMMGEASRISPEAPVPVVRFLRRMAAPGGAANVAMNLLSLGAAVRVVGVIGDDDGGRDLAGELQRAGINTNGIVVDPSRRTTQKTRIMAQRQQMVRVDRETESPLSDAIQQQLQEALETQLSASDILCISDYDKGVASCGLVHRVVQWAAAHGKRVTAGPKPLNMEAFENTEFVSLNESEAAVAAGGKFIDDAALLDAGNRLRQQYQMNALVITLSARGAMLFEKGNMPRHIPAHEVEVFDVAGAGDTFLAAATLAILAGKDNITACEMGNLAAAASVRHVGVVAVTDNDLMEL